MRTHCLIVLLILTLPMVAQAGQSLTVDGRIHQVETTSTRTQPRDRLGLINDGSFEFGECDDGSAWTCTSNTSCSWIIDPSLIWGYAAYDGNLCAWLGGYCGADFNSNSFCQEIFFDGTYLDWYWMTYAGSQIRISVDGIEVFHHWATDTYGEWNSASEVWLDGEPGVDVSDWCGQSAVLCFANQTITRSSMLIDYITLTQSCVTPVEPSSFSTIKTRYP